MFGFAALSFHVAFSMSCFRGVDVLVWTSARCFLWLHFASSLAVEEYLSESCNQSPVRCWFSSISVQEALRNCLANWFIILSDNVFHCVMFFSYAENSAWMHFCCIYKKKKWLTRSSEWICVCFQRQKWNEEGKYFLPSWGLLISQMWGLIGVAFIKSVQLRFWWRKRKTGSGWTGWWQSAAQMPFHLPACLPSGAVGGILSVCCHRKA